MQQAPKTTYQDRLAAINEREAALAALTDEELKARAEALKARLAQKPAK